MNMADFVIFKLKRTSQLVHFLHFSTSTGFGKAPFSVRFAPMFRFLVSDRFPTRYCLIVVSFLEHQHSSDDENLLNNQAERPNNTTTNDSNKKNMQHTTSKGGALFLHLVCWALSSHSSSSSSLQRFNKNNKQQ